MTTELIETPKENAGQLIRHATDAAGVCREIVLKTACTIQGKKYVKCEGWMAIATAHGCIASSRDVQKVEGGWRAIGEIRRIADGVMLSQAEGFVGMDEPTWGKRPEYACRAMAQTRAISRACRAAFAHVVVLIDGGLSTTPAEEVPDGGFNDDIPFTKPAPAAAVNTPQSSGTLTMAGMVSNLAEKPTKSGGTRYGIQIVDVWVNTFNAKFAEEAKQAKANGQPITCEYTEGKYGKDLVSLTVQGDA